MKGHTYEHKDYYIDDTTSDSTITATSKDLLSKREVSDISNQGWLEEIEQSFNKDTTALDDFYDHHTIIQSYLEPTRISQQQHLQETDPLPTHHYHHPPPLHHPHHRRRPSKFSAIKTKVKRVFRLSTTANKHQPSLPVLPTISSTTAAVGEPTSRTWNPSIDSICSSTTTAISRPRSISSSSSEKSHLRRNSCMSSSPFTTSSRGHSTVSKLKNRFSRASSLCALPTQQPVAIKGILKKQTETHHHHHHPHHYQQQQQQQRPNSAIFETTSPRQRKVCANNRFSIHGVPSSNKKRHTVLSTMMTPPKTNHHHHHRQRLPQPSQQLQQQHNVRGVRFNQSVDIHETYAKLDYDRTSDMDAVCTRLTAGIATQIKHELNNYKLHEMQVHDASRKHTHFFL